MSPGLTITTVTEQELRDRRDAILAALGLTVEELQSHEGAGTLSPEEWEAWEQLAAISSLLEWACEGVNTSTQDATVASDGPSDLHPRAEG